MPSSTICRSLHESRAFDKRLKETKDLFEKWKMLTDSGQTDVSSDQLRVYTRGRVIRSFNQP